MRIPVLFCTESGYAIVTIRIDAIAFAELCAIAVARIIQRAQKVAAYEHARRRHLAYAEHTYTSALLSRLG